MSSHNPVRDPFFDNAKFLAIVLVVAGHAIEPLRDVRPAHALYLLVYTFHMPVFIVITGYLSRNFTYSRGRTRKLLTTVGLPYLIFETAYSVFHWAAGNADFEVSLLDPWYLTWFLLALFLWRLSTPMWQQIRFPVAFAVLVSVLAGTSDLSGDLELNRVLGLVPFYVLGLTLKPSHFELLRARTARLLGVLVLLAAVPFSYFVADRHMRTEWTYWRSGNDVLHVSNLTGSAMRIALMVAATVLVAAFLAVVPRRATWFTGLGAATLYAYLLHGFVTKLMQFKGWYDVGFLHTLPGVAVTGGCGALLATLLCTPPVRGVMRWALEPDLSWLFAPRPGLHRARG